MGQLRARRIAVMRVSALYHISLAGNVSGSPIRKHAATSLNFHSDLQMPAFCRIVPGGPRLHSNILGRQVWRVDQSLEATLVHFLEFMGCSLVRM